MEAPLSSLLSSLPIRTALLTDQEGAILLRAGSTADSTSEHELQRLAATFAQTTEHANKLRMGRTRHTTAFYGERTPLRAAHEPSAR